MQLCEDIAPTKFTNVVPGYVILNSLSWESVSLSSGLSALTQNKQLILNVSPRLFIAPLSPFAFDTQPDRTDSSSSYLYRNNASVGRSQHESAHFKKVGRFHSGDQVCNLQAQYKCKKKERRKVEICSSYKSRPHSRWYVNTKTLGTQGGGWGVGGESWVAPYCGCSLSVHCTGTRRLKVNLIYSNLI